MVKGLELFRRHFEGYANQFILIGGTAATLAMEEAGLEFRATKDLDIVLHIEALEPAFGRAFWEFVAKGAYAIREASDTGLFSSLQIDQLIARLESVRKTAGSLLPNQWSQATDGIGDVL